MFADRLYDIPDTFQAFFENNKIACLYLKIPVSGFYHDFAPQNEAGFFTFVMPFEARYFFGPNGPGADFPVENFRFGEFTDDYFGHGMYDIFKKNDRIKAIC
jgi:hypothetical protein